MKAWFFTQRSCLVIGQLPGYAHDLNPVELCRVTCRAVERAKSCPGRVGEARAAVKADLYRIGTNEQLCFNFLSHAGLSL